MPSRFRRRAIGLSLVGACALVLTGCGAPVAVLDPHGPVARSEYHLIVWSFWLMLIVVIPVFALFAYLLIRYRARPGEAHRPPPDETGHRTVEIVWTVIPLCIVVLLAIPTVRTTFRLVHPPSVGAKDPVTIDVTALQWKWVFQYPAQGIETVNYAVIPVGVPVQFMLTADAPMSSFWVPELGGQEMAMPGRELRLWLEASMPGRYAGRNANFSGRGFAHMTFTVIAKPKADFQRWTQVVQQSAPPLSNAQYNRILAPGLVPPMTFSSYSS